MPGLVSAWRCGVRPERVRAALEEARREEQRAALHGLRSAIAAVVMGAGWAMALGAMAAVFWFF